MTNAVYHPRFLLENLINEYLEAKQYSEKKSELFNNFSSNRPNLIQTKNFKKSKNEKYRIGYIVATCSPTTRAHVGLAKQAINDLDLTHLYFIIWPFHYIKGFHARPLLEWVKAEYLIDHGHREQILSLSLAESGIPATAYQDTYDLYKSSEKFFSEDDKNSYFWTGTWFVIRNLQWQIQRSLGIDQRQVEFYFVCGEDQFNPNIYSLIEREGIEKVWKDYSIAEHLALHNIYTVPRGGADDTIERFELSDERISHQITIGQRLNVSHMNATKVRSGSALPLELYCYESAAEYIRAHNFWGYGRSTPVKSSIRPDEIYQPLKKFINTENLNSQIILKDNSNFEVWSESRQSDDGDQYCILFQPESKPYFRKYYFNIQENEQ